MAFRTDPRFETYNSSGYVYKKSSETLLLKSRHKSQVEKVRLVYLAAKPAPAPVVETPVVESTENNTVSAEEEAPASDSDSDTEPSESE